MRIVSMLPSATEILFLLGLGDQVVGVSHECDYPPEARRKPVVIKSVIDPDRQGSAEIDRVVEERLRTGRPIYEIVMDVLRAADPDLIVTQELCDVCAAPVADVQRAVRDLPRNPEVISLTPGLLGDVLEDIERVGEATGRRQEALRVRRELADRVARVEATAGPAAHRPPVFCLEWMDPLYASGHWIPEMVEMAGGVDGLGAKGKPSRKIAWDRVREYGPEVVVLMPCGFDITRTLREIEVVTRRPGWADLPAVRTGRVYAVAGHAYYNRSGPRLVDGLELLGRIIHPDLFGGLPRGGAVKRIERT